MSLSFRSTARLLAFVAVAALAATACSEETVEEPDVKLMMVLFKGATDTVKFQPNCNASKPEVVIPATGATVEGKFLAVNGQPDPLVTVAKYNLAVTPDSRFTRTTSFVGKISGGTSGTYAAIQFALEIASGGQDIFGPCAIVVRIE